MADCSYARCIQERRSIKRELQRWTKNMVYVVGLERVAEELMGRRKWKLYQDVLLARDLPLHQSEENDSTQDQSASDTQETNPPENNGSEREEQPMIATTEALQRNNSAADLTQDTTHDKEEKEAEKHIDPSSPIPVDEDSKEPKDTAAEDGATQKEESNCTNNQQTTIKIKTIEEINTVGNESTRPTNTTETILESLIKRTSTGPPRHKPLPADWKPQDKCYFCVDGELVRPGVEQTSVPAPPEQPASPPTVGVESGSESGSSRSSPKTAQPRSTLPNLLGNQTHPNQGQQPLNPVQASFLQAQAFAHLLQLQQATRAAQQPSLNQVQAMAASLASIGALPNINPALALTLGSPAFLPHWYLQQQQRQQQQESRQPQEEQATPPPRSPAATSEMPLDLSAKPTSGPGTSNSSGTGNQNPPSPSSLEARLAGLRGTPIDKQLFNRTKPRMAPTPGRRTYSETELQMALRDIQSGRLGTRRAAVIYNIPRSTLRNKVYKLEKERGARLPDQLSGAAPRDDSNDNGEDLDDDKDSTVEEDREEERDPPRPVLSMEDVLRYSQMENPSYGQSEHLRALLGKGQKFFDMSSPKQDPPSETAWPLPDQSPMNAYIQQMILANAISAQLPKPEEANPTPMVPEIMRLFSDEHNNILKETLLKRDHMNNGKQSEEELNKRHFSRQSSTASSVITKNDRATPRKTESPEETPMDVDHTVDDSRDSPSNVILKIPSFKPVGPGSNSGKNGGEGFPGSGTPPLPYFSHSPHPEIPTGRPADRLSPSKGIFMLRDVIAKSISQKFQQQSSVPNHNNDLRHLKVSSPGMDGMDGMNAFKRSNLTSPGGGQGISVIKNLTSHDLTRSFGSANAGLSNQQSNATGGKGTRPKRGKYRNYDRDSLVEAVKAVQRGEMSVHRAGSYYGVPHSTLEYKVKERHLMRPRKREPKNPNPDDKLPTPSVSSKPPDISNPGILRQDKSKILQKPPTKPNFPATSPNGLKMPNLFDGNLGLGYNPSPFPFWHPGAAFPGLNVDFQQRNPGAPGNFPPNSDPFFASQMMQKLQEESIRHPGLARKDSVGESSRDLPENTENNTNANGSFVENIIRSSLERQRPGGSEGDNETGDAVRRRIRPDDALLAEEMREAARRLRAREGVPPNLGMSPPSSQAHPS